MAIKLVKRNKLAVTVKGTLPDENGKPEHFDFKLHCERLSQDEIDNVRQENGGVKAFIRRVVEGWDAVLDEAGQSVPFSTNGLEELIDYAGMPLLVLRCYMEQVGAAAKN
jgi:hypothetical protein